MQVVHALASYMHVGMPRRYTNAQPRAWRSHPRQCLATQNGLIAAKEGEAHQRARQDFGNFSRTRSDTAFEMLASVASKPQQKAGRKASGLRAPAAKRRTTKEPAEGPAGHVRRERHLRAALTPQAA